MGIFTSSKRRAEHAAQTRLSQAQANANRLRMFLVPIVAGLDSDGYRYAQRAIGALVAIGGWPSLVSFVYHIGSFEFDFARITNEDEGWRMDRGFALTAMQLLQKAFAGSFTVREVNMMPAVACMLMVWWGVSDLAEPQHAVVRLIRHFGGDPCKMDSVGPAMDQRFRQICSRITPEAHEVWKQAEREMSTYGNGLAAA
jgi:hypothetical protein